MKRKILFFGELPPNIIHGASLLNNLNIEILNKYYSIDIVEEKSSLLEHKKRSFSKIAKLFSYIQNIFTLNRKNNYNHFYSIFAFSTFGSLKTLLGLISFKIIGRGSSLLFIYRGDFIIFYDKSFFNRFITNMIFKLTDKLVVMSNFQRKELNNFIDPNKVYVLENSLSDEFEFKGKKNGFKKFLYISNYIKEKGIFELLEVFRILEKDSCDFGLECFGGFTNEKDKQGIMSYKSNKIKINGFINGEKKFRKIYEADCLILPSWNEGQPTIILEAMSQGTIVLCTKVGLIGEMFGDDYPFYFEIQNINSFKDCIEKFIHYKHKELLSKELKERYKNNFSKIIHEEKLLKIFGENIG